MAMDGVKVFVESFRGRVSLPRFDFQEDELMDWNGEGDGGGTSIGDCFVRLPQIECADDFATRRFCVRRLETVLQATLRARLS